MEDLDLVLSDGKSEVNSCTDSSALDTFFAKYLSKKGKVSSLMGYMKEIAKENKAA